TTSEELVQLRKTTDSRQYFVSIRELKPLETGLQSVEQKIDKYTNKVSSEKITGNYLAAPLETQFGKKVLLIKTPLTTLSSSYEESPIYKWLEHYTQPPATTAQMIEEELRRPAEVWSIGSLKLTSSWLMNQSFFDLTIMNLIEVVWVYQKVTRHYYNFIPTGK